MSRWTMRGRFIAGALAATLVASRDAGPTAIAEPGAWCDVTPGVLPPDPPPSADDKSRVGIGANEVDVLVLVSETLVQQRGMEWLRRHLGQALSWGNAAHDLSQTGIVLRGVGIAT